MVSSIKVWPLIKSNRIMLAKFQKSEILHLGESFFSLSPNIFYAFQLNNMKSALLPHKLYEKTVIDQMKNNIWLK